MGSFFGGALSGGSATATGASVGSVVPGLGTAIGAGVGAAIDGLKALLGNLFGGGADKISDTKLVESLRASLQPIWDQARDTVGQLGLEVVSTQTGLRSMSASEAQALIGPIEESNQQVLSAYLRSESRNNFVHTTMVPILLRRLRLISDSGTRPGGFASRTVAQVKELGSFFKSPLSLILLTGGVLIGAAFFLRR